MGKKVIAQKEVKVFRGIVVPARGYEEDFLYVTDDDGKFITFLGITDFFPKVVDPSCCGMYGKECNNTDCKYNKDGVCRLPRYRVNIVVEYEELGDGE